MIQLDNISLAFEQQIIFDQISCTINANQKIGLIGRNGSGKTTLLNLIAGKQFPDNGQIKISKTFHCAFMPQNVVFTSERSILNETLNAVPQLNKLLNELKRTELLMSNKENSEEQERYVTTYQQLYEKGYEHKKNQAKKILINLGFTQTQLDQPVTSLSSGWKMRLILASLLLQEADFYLFDEPTNHLDLPAKDWFVEFLRTSSFGFMLVSHDEYFLNTVCDYIYEISHGHLTEYQGNYCSYILQKESNENIRKKKYSAQQKFIKKQQATIERFRYKASKATMVQSMINALKKTKKVEIESEQKIVNVKLPVVQHSGKIVLDIKDLSFSFGTQKIFEHATFQIQRHQRVAIIAPNGTGKTTLLNLIINRYTPTSGTIAFGYNVKSAFFEQDQNQSLDPKNTILQEIELSCETSDARIQARNILGAFLFSGDDVYKKIEVLSGGEKNRIAMAKILLKNANLLILDEPTNHLDITSKNILRNALAAFKGTILFVSHDRMFLNRLATNIVELTSNAVFSYTGNYDSYLQHKKYLISVYHNNKSQSKDHTPLQNTRTKKHSHEKHILNKQISKLEQSIKHLEEQSHKITKIFETSLYGSPEYDKALIALQKNQQEHKKQYELWEDLMTKIEKVT